MTATWIEAGSAALVGIVALGTIIGWIVRQANQRQSAHITAVVAQAIDAKLKPIKDTVGDKNGNNQTAMQQIAELLRGQEKGAELDRQFIELHQYAHDEIHRLNGPVRQMWRDWAISKGVDPDILPPPEPSPKASK